MGVLDAQAEGLFAKRHGRIVFRDKIMGGTPKNGEIIEAWLRSKAGIDREEEIRQATLRTLIELGADIRADASYAEVIEASKQVAGAMQTNGFKRDEHGLYIEARHLKAALKESTNILFAGDRWGRTKKGPRSFVAERIFVRPDRLHLGVQEPSGIEQWIAHVNGPHGPQSSLTYVEYVEHAEFAFEVWSTRDEVTPQQWAQIWVHAQENGLGAVRSQGFGRFDLEEWSTD